MIITCCTGSYFKWGELFLRSFKVTNGTDIPIHINGVWLSDKQIKTFHNIYPNLTIENRTFTDGWIAKKYGVTLKDVKRCKEAISKGFKHRCRFWMDFIVVDGRISWLLDTMKKNKDVPWWLHIDIDMMFRFSIQSLINKIEKSDIVCRFRPDRTFIKKPPKKPKREVPDYMKIAGGMVGLRGKNGIKFVEKWLEEIHSKKGEGIHGRGEPWGQTTLYYAYEYYKDDFKWEQIEEEWLLASCNPKNPIWCGHKKGNIVYGGKKYGCDDRTQLRDIFFKELKIMEEDKQKIWMNSIKTSPEKR